MRWPERLARNVRVVEAYASGLYIAEIAREMDLDEPTVRGILSSAGIKGPLRTVKSRAASTRGAQKQAAARRQDRRNEEIRRAVALGESLAELGRRYEVSRQRIQQIAKEGQRAT